MKPDFSTPQVMAIVNVTPDSFYDGGRTFDADTVARRIEAAVDEGATLLDIGGYSSRPGADEVPVEEEWRRVAIGLEAVRRTGVQAAVSVDTFRSTVAERAVENFGELIVNDISAGELDRAMIPTVARLGVPYVAMHMRGTPQTMQAQTDYAGGIVDEVTAWAARKTAQLLEAGIRRDRILLDPGFGFAKTLEQNYALLAGLHRLCATGYPVVAGVSRKSMIWRALGTTSEEALAGTVALEWECLRQGAAVLRAHDVRAAADTVKLYEIYRENKISLPEPNGATVR